MAGDAVLLDGSAIDRTPASPPRIFQYGEVDVGSARIPRIATGPDRVALPDVFRLADEDAVVTEMRKSAEHVISVVDDRADSVAAGQSGPEDPTVGRSEHGLSVVGFPREAPVEGVVVGPAVSVDAALPLLCLVVPVVHPAVVAAGDLPRPAERELPLGGVVLAVDIGPVVVLDVLEADELV